MSDRPLPESERTIDTPIRPPAGLDYAVQRDAIPGLGVCDFCGTPVPDDCRTYPCEPVTIAVLLTEGGSESQLSADPWAACPDCAELLDRDARTALLRRAVRLIRARTPDVSARALEALVKTAHDAFHRARIR